MKNINALVSSALLTGPLFFSAYAQEKPNVIIIFNDDMGYRDLGCYGAPKIKTPRIDQLAKEGVRMTDFYSCSSVSSSSRAALLTGCYPQRVGVMGVIGAGTYGGLSPLHITIAEMLKGAGYVTAAVGKWHLGDMQQFLPTKQGFDSYYGIPFSNDNFPSRHTVYAADCLWRNGFSEDSLKRVFAKLAPTDYRPMSVKENVPLLQNNECIEFPVDQTTITKRYASQGIKFIEKSVADKKPFFLYLANSMPHVPLSVSPEFKGKSAQGLYGDVIEEIDYNTGRILDKLKELGIDKNTIVIFSSDNGPWLQYKEHSGSALPLFEGKFSSFEGGMRVPCIVRWPNTIPAGNTSSVLTSTIDILPTLASVSGSELPDAVLDGKNILNILKGDNLAVSPHEYFFCVYEGLAVRSGVWKYHKTFRYTTTPNSLRIKAPALYNLKNDIGEKTNLINKQPATAARLAKALEAHLKRINE